MFLRDALEILGSDHSIEPTPLEASRIKSRQKEEELETKLSRIDGLSIRTGTRYSFVYYRHGKFVNVCSGE